MGGAEGEARKAGPGPLIEAVDEAEAGIEPEGGGGGGGGGICW